MADLNSMNASEAAGKMLASERTRLGSAVTAIPRLRGGTAFLSVVCSCSILSRVGASEKPEAAHHQWRR